MPNIIQMMPEDHSVTLEHRLQYAEHVKRALIECHAYTFDNLNTVIYCCERLGIPIYSNIHYDSHQFKAEKEIGRSLRIINAVNLLTPANRVKLEQHITTKCQQRAGGIQSQPSRPLNFLADALERLALNNLLTQSRLRDILEHATPDDLSKALFILGTAPVLTPDPSAVTRGCIPNMYRLFGAMRSIKINPFSEENALLTPENQAVVKRHANLTDLLAALRILRMENMLNQDNFTAVSEHHKPDSLALVLQLQRQHDFTFTVENRSFMRREKNLIELEKALSALDAVDLLTQENVNALFLHAKILLACGERPAVWTHLPNRDLTQECFNEIVRICENASEDIDAGRQAFILFVSCLERDRIDNHVTRFHYSSSSYSE